MAEGEVIQKTDEFSIKKIGLRGDKLRLNEIVELQINRTLEALNIGQNTFLNALEGLRGVSFLVGADDKLEKDLAVIDKDYKRAIEVAQDNPRGIITSKEQFNIYFVHACKKLHILLAFFKRSGLGPMEEVEVVIE